MRWALFRTFLRSYFLQTLWNFERMQNLGFAFSMAPALKRVRSSKAAYTATLRKHMQFFNTHPYFAPIVMGVVARREAARPPTSTEEDAALTALKDSMGAAFGAVGDHVIWGTWRPFCALLALSLGLLVAYPTIDGKFETSFFEPEASRVCALWWVAVFLGLFNSLQVWLRAMGLSKAYTQGPGVVNWVQSLRLQSWASHIRRLGLVVTAALSLGYLTRWRDSSMLFWMFGILLGSIVLKRWSVSGLAIFYLVCIASVAMTLLGIHWP